MHSLEKLTESALLFLYGNEALSKPDWSFRLCSAYGNIKKCNMHVCAEDIKQHHVERRGRGAEREPQMNTEVCSSWQRRGANSDTINCQKQQQQKTLFRRLNLAYRPYVGKQAGIAIFALMKRIPSEGWTSLGDVRRHVPWEKSPFEGGRGRQRSHKLSFSLATEWGNARTTLPPNL